MNTKATSNLSMKAIASASAMPSSPSIVEIVSRQEVKPSPGSPHGRICHLSPWDVSMLCGHYIQKGLLFTDLPPTFPVSSILSLLKSSLSDAIRHFYPLAGRLLTQTHRDENGKADGLEVCIDCNDQGAEFIHAVAEKIHASDFLATGKDIPSFVNSFFPLNGGINHDGHDAPLLSVQVTELAGGNLFLACCFNHVIGDGTSYWNFFNGWAEIARTNVLSRPPALERWFIDGESPPVRLPFTDPSQFVVRFLPPALRERFFHFSNQSIAKLKARANKEAGTEQLVISSFQALSALIWRAITRARGLKAEQPTSCSLAINNRERLRPKQSAEYFGNSINVLHASAAAGELLGNGLGWAARELNRAIAEHTDAAIRGFLRAYHEAPMVYSLTMFDQQNVTMASSPRFDMYGGDFGFGKAAAVRCGPANKFDGNVFAFPGREGGGSVDLEVCLIPEYMAALLEDKEFTAAVAPSS